jgi:hypothetical protein
VENAPVNELSEKLRSKLEKKAGKKWDLLLGSFFDACDARAEEATRKRAHMASEESSPGKQQQWLCFFFFSLSLCSFSLSLALASLRSCV